MLRLKGLSIWHRGIELGNQGEEIRYRDDNEMKEEERSREELARSEMGGTAKEVVRRGGRVWETRHGVSYRLLDWARRTGVLMGVLRSRGGIS